MTNAQAEAQPSAPWIISSSYDLVLFVGTPFLIVPALLLASGHWAAEDIALVVAAFGATGHHLPGMMRAYGDRALFKRFKSRFIFAPIFLAGVCILSYVYGLTGITVVALIWGVWHGLMQTYGFMRIYDAKARSFAPMTAKLDFYMCVAWFGFGFIDSEYRMFGWMDDFYRSGGPFIAAEWIQALRWIWIGMTALVSAAFIIHAVRQQRAGNPANPIKFALMFTSFGFWWFCMSWSPNMILGVAMFELFHDSQYLSIVWLFNRNRAERDVEVGSFTAFVFRQRIWLVLLYVGLVALYGAWDYIDQSLVDGSWQSALIGLMVASALLHFYYDGFIWKVREQDTGGSLGLKGGTGRLLPRISVSSWKWSLFIVPLLVLAYTQSRVDLTELERLRLVVHSLPKSSMAHNNLGVVLQAEQKFDEARSHYQRALDLYPEYAEAHHNLGSLMLLEEQSALAEQHLQRAVEIRVMRSGAVRDLAHALRINGKYEEAASRYQAVLKSDHRDADALTGLAMTYLYLDQPEQAADSFARALTLNPLDPITHANLATLRRNQGRHEEAIQHHQRAMELAPERTDFAMEMALSLMAANRHGDAVEPLKRILQRDPQHLHAHRYLGAIYAETGQPGAAVEHLEFVVQQTGDTNALVGLGSVLAQTDQLDAAERQLKRALANDAQNAEAHHWLGRIYDRRQDPAQARFHFEQAVAGEPDNADQLNRLGIVFLKMKDPQAARGALQRSVAADPNFAAAHANLAISLGQLGDPDEARHHFEEALRLEPDHRAAHFYLNRMALQAGDWEAVRHHATALLKIDPEDDEAQRALHMAEAKSIQE